VLQDEELIELCSRAIRKVVSQIKGKGEEIERGWG
jgi:hypothetical protein